MKKRNREVFLELIRNSKKSDREIAKKLGISQPTVTRIRKKLEKKIIKSYTALPVFPEIGIDLISFNFGRCENPHKDVEICFKNMAKKNKKIIFISAGEGLGKNCLIVALHKDYRDYLDFLKFIRSQCKSAKNEFESFLVPTSKEHNLDFATPIINLSEK
jgi:DNA-binding Lrp family transcriptional regulator